MTDARAKESESFSLKGTGVRNRRHRALVPAPDSATAPAGPREGQSKRLLLGDELPAWGPLSLGASGHPSPVGSWGTFLPFI